MTAVAKVDLNADMGEGFGRWTLGDDASLMPYVTSSNIACGFHGGDPHIMRRCVQLATDHGTAVGAHVAFPDLIGFGRRRIDVTCQELKDYVTYQVGALLGFAEAQGVKVEHVKPHSAFYKICMVDDDYAHAMAEAIHEIDRNLILLMSGDRVANAASAMGIPYVEEGFVDLEYDEKGDYVPEWPKKHWRPEDVAERALIAARDGVAPLRGGGSMKIQARSLCIHGEADNSAVIAKAVRERLAGEGVDVVPLRELL